MQIYEENSLFCSSADFINSSGLLWLLYKSQKETGLVCWAS